MKRLYKTVLCDRWRDIQTFSDIIILMNLAVKKEIEPTLTLLDFEKCTLGSLTKILKFPIVQVLENPELYWGENKYLYDFASSGKIKVDVPGARETYMWNDRDELVAIDGRVTESYDYRGLRCMKLTPSPSLEKRGEYVYLKNNQPALKRVIFNGGSGDDYLSILLFSREGAAIA